MVRTLVTDSFGSQSRMYIDDPTALSGEYSEYYRLAFHFVPEVRRLLVIGGGAYTVPKYFAANYPEINIDVVEIDPGMTELARTYFALEEK